MLVLIRIAFRNMWEHKAKSLIIGSLLGFGVIIMILGNSMMDSASDGLKQGYIDSFTGNLMVSGISDQPFSIFGSESMDMTGDNEVPLVQEYPKIYQKLKEDPRVASVSGLVTTYGIFSKELGENPLDEESGDGNSMPFGILFGVDVSSYFTTFPSIKLEEGRYPEVGESAVLLPASIKEKIEKKYGVPLQPGDKLLITGVMGGMRLREVTYMGWYSRGEVSGDAPFVICDVDTVRVLAGLTMSIDEDIELSSDQTALLSTDNLDDLFDDLFSDDMISVAERINTKERFDSASNLLGDTSKREFLNTAETGSWHFLLVRLHDAGNTYPVIADMNTWIKDEGIEARAADWKAASGTFGKMADFVRIVFNIAILVIAIVAIIIIMNTLVISIIERTAEIGTMRALGAKRSFVRIMFLTETLTQSIFFGALGAFISVLGLTIVNALKIPLENGFAKLLLGGSVVHLVPSLGTVFSTVFAVFLVGWLAHLYPVSIALKIQPVKAMQTE